MSVITEMLERLHAERHRAWGEQKALLEEIRSRTDARPSGEEREKLQRLDKALDDLDADIKDYQSREQREAEHDRARGEYEKVVRPEVIDRADASRDEQVRAFLRGERKDLIVNLAPIAREKAAVRMGLTGKEYRDLAVVTAAAGGNTVPTTFERQLYDFLEVFSGVRRTNVTVITTSSGENMDFPKVASHGTAAVVGEGSALAEVDPTFGKTTITTYKYGQLIQVTTELLQDSAVDILGFVARDTARALARVTDTAYVTGSGSNAPFGLLPRMGTATTIQTASTGVPSYGNLIDTIYSVNEEYRANGAQWLMRDAMAAAIRKIVDTTGRPLWEPSFVLGQPDRLLGFPVVTDPNMGAVGTAASTPIAFGDFSSFYVRDAAGVRFERSDEFAFSSDLVTFRSILRTGSDLVDLTGAVKKVLEPTT